MKSSKFYIFMKKQLVLLVSKVTNPLAITISSQFIDCGINSDQLGCTN